MESQIEPDFISEYGMDSFTEAPAALDIFDDETSDIASEASMSKSISMSSSQFIDMVSDSRSGSLRDKGYTPGLLQDNSSLSLTSETSLGGGSLRVGGFHSAREFLEPMEAAMPVDSLDITGPGIDQEQVLGDSGGKRGGVLRSWTEGDDADEECNSQQGESDSTSGSSSKSGSGAGSFEASSPLTSNGSALASPAQQMPNNVVGVGPTGARVMLFSRTLERLRGEILQENLRMGEEFAASVPGLCAGFLHDGTNLTATNAEPIEEAEDESPEGNGGEEPSFHSVDPRLIGTGYIASLSALSDGTLADFLEECGASSSEEGDEESVEGGEESEGMPPSAVAHMEDEKEGVVKRGGAMWPHVGLEPVEINTFKKSSEGNQSGEDWTMSHCLCSLFTFSWLRWW